MHWNEWDAPSYGTGISRPSRRARAAQTMSLPEGLSVAEAAEALRLEARTRLRSQMGTSQDSIFFSGSRDAIAAAPAHEAQPYGQVSPSDRWRTEYDQKFHKYSTEEHVCANVGPFGSAYLQASADHQTAKPDPRPLFEPQPTEQIPDDANAQAPAPNALPNPTLAPAPALPLDEPALIRATEQESGPSRSSSYSARNYEDPVPADHSTKYVENECAAPLVETQQPAPYVKSSVHKEKWKSKHETRTARKLRRADITSRDLPDTAVQGALNSGRAPFHCYGRGDGSHALPGGEINPSLSLRKGCGRDRKTYNVKAETFARSGGSCGKPVYQQVDSSALYGREAIKNFDNYVRTEHRAAVERGEDPLTHVGWPSAQKSLDDNTAKKVSFHQAQIQKNQKAMDEVNLWEDTHDYRAQKWLQKWQRRQADKGDGRDIWDRLSTPVAHNLSAKDDPAERKAAQKAQREAEAWAARQQEASETTETMSERIEKPAMAVPARCVDAGFVARTLAAGLPEAARKVLLSDRKTFLRSLANETAVTVGTLVSSPLLHRGKPRLERGCGSMID